MTSCRRRPKRAAAAALILLAAGACDAPPQPPPPDVVVITIDTLRPDHLGFYGAPREPAPFLAELAAGSAIYRRAYTTASWTAPATASLFTSLYPLEHGITEGFFAHKASAEMVEETGRSTIPLNGIPGTVTTLPELFQRRGYQTFGVGANINIGPEIGFDRGFDHFERIHRGDARQLLAKLEAWRPQFQADQPKFFYLHFNDVHEPYHRREPWWQPTGSQLGDVIAAYDSELHFLDAALRDMFTSFGWNEERTIVVVLSDHGEEFMEHGQVGHNFTLFPELIQTLLMVRAPAHGVHAGERTAAASIIDVLPTLAALVGAAPEPGWRGRSLVEPDSGTARPVFSHRRQASPAGELESVVLGDLLMIRGGHRRGLFDLTTDPFAQRDRANADPAAAERLAGVLDAHRASLQPAADAAPAEIPLDRDSLDELRSLGYVQ